MIEWIKSIFWRFKASQPANWYPDDSGEWVEVSDSRMAMPYCLNSYSGMIGVLFKGAREVYFEGYPADYPDVFDWNVSPDMDVRIVAYRKV